MSPVFLSVPGVDLVQHIGSDSDVVRAARVSVHGTNEVPSGDVRGMIRHMMTNRHGSVFEHNLFTFRIHAPIFTAREFMRHRMFSFNEESARYRELDPVFWVPGPSRKLRQSGKPAAYEMSDGTEADYVLAHDVIWRSSLRAHQEYQAMLAAGIAREVARAVLPVNTYTSFYATCNARSLMHFLSLRIDHPDNQVPSHPQAEIQDVAVRMEGWLQARMPETYWAWHSTGRTAP